MLRTSDENQKVFAMEIRTAVGNGSEICNIVAVTAENNVAPVEMLIKTRPSRSCWDAIAGIPAGVDRVMLGNPKSRGLKYLVR